MTEEKKLDVVLDANVVLDMICRADVYRTGEERYGFVDRIDADEEADPLGVRTELVNSDPEVRIRLVRALYGLALPQHLHKTKVRAYSYMFELLKKLKARVPPGSRSMAEAEIALFVHYLKEEVFYGWDWVYDKEAKEVAGNDADQHLVDFAAEHGAILISNEGLRRDLTANPKAGIRRRAAVKGVPVYTVVDYFAREGVDVKYTAKTSMMRLWYYFDKHGLMRAGTGQRLREFAIIINWDTDEP